MRNWRPVVLGAVLALAVVAVAVLSSGGDAADVSARTLQAAAENSQAVRVDTIHGRHRDRTPRRTPRDRDRGRRQRRRQEDVDGDPDARRWVRSSNAWSTDVLYMDLEGLPGSRRIPCPWASAGCGWTSATSSVGRWWRSAIKPPGTRHSEASSTCGGSPEGSRRSVRTPSQVVPRRTHRAVIDYEKLADELDSAASAEQRATLDAMLRGRHGARRRVDRRCGSGRADAVHARRRRVRAARIDGQVEVTMRDHRLRRARRCPAAAAR